MFTELLRVENRDIDISNYIRKVVDMNMIGHLASNTY